MGKRRSSDISTWYIDEVSDIAIRAKDLELVSKSVTDSNFYMYIAALERTGNPETARLMAGLTHLQIEEKEKLSPDFKFAADEAKHHLVHKLESIYIDRAINGWEKIETDSNGREKRTLIKDLHGLEFLLAALVPERYRNKGDASNGKGSAPIFSINIMNPLDNQEKVVDVEPDNPAPPILMSGD